MLNIWDHYLYTQDENILHENFELMQDCILFIISDALKIDSNGNHHLRELICVDESVKKKRNDLLTVAVTKRSIKILRDAARITGITINEAITKSEAAFDFILATLKKDGVYKAYDDADIGNWAVLLAYLHLPEPEVLNKALSDILSGCEESQGLSLSHSSRMRCATFPWVEGIFSWAMAVNKNPAAIDYLLKMTRFPNFYGGLPEYIWNHGEPSRDWFVAAHGVFVAALSEILFQANENDIDILPCGKNIVPWQKLKLNDFRLPGAIAISMDFHKTSDACSITLKNHSGNEKQLTIGYNGNCKRLSLGPDTTVALKLSLTE